MARPRIAIDETKLKALMRLSPTLEDTAAFMEVSTDTIERHLKREYSQSFAEFRQQNMVHTRLMLIRTAIKQAESGNTAMLIFCLKNLCGWRDRPEEDKTADIFKNMALTDLIKLVREKIPEIESRK